LRLFEHLTQRLSGLEIATETRTALLDLFRLVRIAPDLRVGQPLLKLVDFALFRGDIKETPEARRLSP